MNNMTTLNRELLAAHLTDKKYNLDNLGKMTYATMATNSGLSITFIHMVINKTQRNMEMESFLKLCDYLGNAPETYFLKS